MDQNVRNFKDFLQLYNRISEICFQQCVDNLNGRSLDQIEGICVDDCAGRFIKYNHKLMNKFVKYQGALMNKRINESMEQNEAIRNDSVQIDNSTVQPAVTN